ncbi:MAG: permease, partial [Candidatus Eremiobacteraeota bacterium]|nr:permease [Candidatus Eremiobacteraeota bacterium]
LALVALMAVLVKLTYPKSIVEEARHRVDEPGGHDHGDNVITGKSLWDKLRNPQTQVLVAQNVAMDWSMLRTDLILGFLIAGALGALVPSGAWKALFLAGAPGWVALPLNAVLGPLIAVISFVCSIGNVPMAAILWGSGISFGGVLSFLYADLIVLPLLDVYRRYYGWKMAAYIGAVFFVTMFAAGIVMDVAFGAFHAIPSPNPNLRADMVLFKINYTFWLNLFFGGIAAYMWYLNRRHPMMHSGHEAHHAGFSA